jgi:hypothetical protein
MHFKERHDRVLTRYSIVKTPQNYINQEPNLSATSLSVDEPIVEKK